MKLGYEPAVHVRELRGADVASTAELLAHAFVADPAYAYLFPALETRIAGLRDFFARNLRTHLPYACTFVAVDGGDRPLATVTLRPPAGIDISLWTMLRRGLLPFAIAHGRAAVQRLFWLKRTYDALEADAADHQSHAYVHMMAVLPEHQGRGLGTHLLSRVLAASAGAGGLRRTVLATHLDRNVAFYERHGFELLSQRTLQPPDSHSYTVWSMRTLSDAGRE